MKEILVFYTRGREREGEGEEERERDLVLSTEPHFSYREMKWEMLNPLLEFLYWVRAGDWQKGEGVGPPLVLSGGRLFQPALVST
jgi:hypothetical protein